MADGAASWRLEIRDGLHRGAVLDMPAGSLLLLGADAQCELVLADAGVAPRHLSLLVGASGVELRALDAAIACDETVLAPGARCELHGSAAIGLPGSAVTLRLESGAGRADGEPVALPPLHAPARDAARSPTHEATHEAPPPAARDRRRRRWLAHATAVAASLAIVAGVAAAAIGAAADKPALSRDALAALLDASGLQHSLRIVEEGAGLGLRGVVEPAAAQALRQQLAQRGWRVAAQWQTPAQLLAAAENVFRTHGISVSLRYLGDGRLEAAQVDPADPRIRELAQTVRSDVAGLNELRFAPYTPPRPAVTDPGKRMTAIVNGPAPYIATADNSRYLVGALLPDGHRVRAIDAEGVQLERDGTTTRLRIDD